MGLMAVALDLLLLIHPMSNAQDELKEMSSSRQDLGVLNVLSSCSVSACTQHVHAAAAVSVQHYRSYVGWESVMGRYWEAEALQQ